MLLTSCGVVNFTSRPRLKTVSQKWCNYRSPEKQFYRSGRLLEHWRLVTWSNTSPSTSWIKHSKPAITTKGMLSETAVLLLNSFSAVNNFTLVVLVNVNIASSALLKLIHRVTIQSASFSNVFFHSHSHQQKSWGMTSHYNLPSRLDKRTY